MKAEIDKEIKDAIGIATRQTSYNAKMFAPYDKQTKKYKKTGGRLRTEIRPVITDKGYTG